ncbi:MAG TPA: enoyl-CoA hydratase-related protein [Candidatus Limnocylindrales bacterium]|nr:enoyl-CoA hydratase-related protein [Candidatus Limnocylindrales bacterium]
MTDDAGRSVVSVAFPAGAPARDGVALLTLNRAEARNALSFSLLNDLDHVLAVLDDDEGCRAIVITGAGERAFAAGADIGDLAGSSREQLRRDDPFAVVDRVGRLRTPVIAAVRGYALGGGCELALACDIIVAGDDAVFGQPEVSIGVIPGAGGTQRLARAVGRARAMDLVLTGRQLRAADAERMGLVSVVVPPGDVLPAALDRAAAIAALPVEAVRAAKAAVNASQQLPLDEGLRFERDRFEALFDTEDQGEGMAAFLEKRPAVWRHR